MEILRGIITTSSDGYNSSENSFTLVHNVPNLYCAPCGFTIKTNDGEYESIEVSDIEYNQYSIKIYFGSLELSGSDRIGYMFSVVTGENSNSDSFSWSDN